VPALRLRAIAGSRSGSRAEELSFAGPRVRIGRSRDNDLILPDRDEPLASARHAEALLDSSGAWTIVDLGSANGTRVNDVPVQRQRLKSGDRLAFGDESFAVLIGDRAARLKWLAPVLLLALAATIGVLLTRLRTTPGFQRIGAEAARSVFLIALDEQGRRSVVGTAFATKATDGAVVLVTNAHVAQALRARGAFAEPPNARALAVQSDSYDARSITAVAMDSRWKSSSLEGDLALLRVAGGSPIVPLALGDSATLARGTPIAAFGFPAVSTDPMRPRGRLTVDVLGDVRGDYLAVGLGVAPGTSGSPVFDASGRVIGVVAGGDFVDGPDGARPSGSSANWAIGSTAIADFIRRASAARTP